MRTTSHGATSSWNTETDRSSRHDERPGRADGALIDERLGPGVS
ncbi:hypothetical protein NJ7G_1128 [Natrinema sp. J7-2]|nr:hypothetical protein NJ7G_1128 [Natrinema sp. J7-2]